MVEQSASRNNSEVPAAGVLSVVGGAPDLGRHPLGNDCVQRDVRIEFVLVEYAPGGTMRGIEAAGAVADAHFELALVQSVLVDDGGVSRFDTEFRGVHDEPRRYLCVVRNRRAKGAAAWTLSRWRLWELLRASVAG